MKLKDLDGGITLYRSDEKLLRQFPDVENQLLKLIESGKKDACIAEHPQERLNEALNDKRCILALDKEKNLIGFCYLQVADEAPTPYVEPSLIIMASNYRGKKISKEIRKHVYEIADTRYPNHDIIAITFVPSSYSYIKKVLGFEEIDYQKAWEDYQLDFSNIHFYNTNKNFKRHSKGFKPLDQMQMICNISNYPFWILRKEKSYFPKRKTDSEKKEKLPRKNIPISV